MVCKPRQVVRCGDAVHVVLCCSSLYNQDQSVYKSKHVVRCVVRCCSRCLLLYQQDQSVYKPKHVVHWSDSVGAYHAMLFVFVQKRSVAGNDSRFTNRSVCSRFERIDPFSKIPLLGGGAYSYISSIKLKNIGRHDCDDDAHYCRMFGYSFMNHSIVRAMPTWVDVNRTLGRNERSRVLSAVFLCCPSG